MEQNTNTTPTPPANNGKGLGIAGMILGILAIILSFVPCFGFWAIILAVVGVILSAISLSQAKKAGASKGMAIAGLICSILAIIIGSIWLFIIAKAVNEGGGLLKEAMEQSGAMDSLNKAMEQLKNITDTLQQH
jgi:large-conductance mechanosensitive channel